MRKIIKIFLILFIVIELLFSLSQIVYAIGEAKEVLGQVGEEAGYDSDALRLAGVTSIATAILSAVRNIAVIVAMIMISVLGVQYMLGSAEQKASYKKAFIPLIVGVILVASAAQITTMLFKLGNGGSDSQHPGYGVHKNHNVQYRSDGVYCVTCGEYIIMAQ